MIVGGWPPMMRTGVARLTSKAPCGGTDASVGLPDLLIAAVTDRERAAVLHYDGNYELIAQVTGQPVQWAVASTGGLAQMGEFADMAGRVPRNRSTGAGPWAILTGPRW